MFLCSVQCHSFSKMRWTNMWLLRMRYIMATPNNITSPKEASAALARQAVLFLLLAYALRLALNLTLMRLHLPWLGIFEPINDNFADSLKTAMAETSVSAPLFTSQDVRHWPALFQFCLLHNPYLGLGLSIYLLPPMSTLQLMAVARLMVLTSPWTALGAEILVYVLLVAFFMLVLRRWRILSDSTLLLLALSLLFSYPAQYMLNRGNFHSGFTSICLALYFCTAFTRRWQWLGILA